MNTREDPSRTLVCDSTHLALRPRAMPSTRDARRRRLWLARAVLVLSAMACDHHHGRDCRPGDCPAGRTCSIGGGCELQLGSCATDAECAEGDVCVTISGTGLLGPYVDRICQPGPGGIGEPCNLGSAPVGTCVQGAVCSSENTATMSPAPDTGIGSHYWLDTRDTFDATTQFQPPRCVPSHSLGVGAPCSDSSACAPDLVCHWGYVPRQCRPPSDVGQPCGVDDECLSGACDSADTEQSCARADPRCDIRVDPSCGYWLSCAQCIPSN